MTYQTSVADNYQFQTNIVVLLEGEYWGRYQPDSGLTIDSDKLILDGATIPPTKVSLKRGTQQINSTTLKFIDKNERFSALIGTDEGALVNRQIKVYLGRVNEAMDFADYIEINTYNIQGISKNGNIYTVKAVSKVNLFQKPVFDASGNLDSSINDTATTLDLFTETDKFQSSGILKLGDEYMNYNGTSFAAGITTFTGITRGTLGSTATGHTAGVEAFEVLELDGNPIDLFLRLLVSPGGGGTYDVYHDGAGLAESLIDVTAVEAIRDTFFSGESFTLYISNEENLLKYIEKQLLQPNNLRLIEDATNGKVSLAILDQSDFTADVFELTEATNTKERPKWRMDDREIQNTVTVRYAWLEGLARFTRTITRTDDDSIAKYGLKKGPTIEIKGAQVAAGGDAIAADRASRYLARFSTPRARIDTTGLMKTSLVNVGQKVRYTTSELPQEGGALGMSSVVEVLEKGISAQTGLVKFKLIFTSYSNLRIGLIAPSPILDLAIVDQKTFNVPDGSCFEKGYVLRLKRVSTNSIIPPATEPDNVVSSVDGNQITMENDFVTTLDSDIRLKFVPYDRASITQRARYAFACPNTGFFDDGSKGYQIIF